MLVFAFAVYRCGRAFGSNNVLSFKVLSCPTNAVVHLDLLPFMLCNVCSPDSLVAMKQTLIKRTQIPTLATLAIWMRRSVAFISFDYAYRLITAHMNSNELIGNFVDPFLFFSLTEMVQLI